MGQITWCVGRIGRVATLSRWSFRVQAPDASPMPLWWNGRHASLRGWWEQSRMGSSPIDGTIMAPWRRWLSRRPVTPEVAGSIPAGVANIGVWCNGSMTVSKTVDDGSSPSAPANKDTYSNIYVLSFLSNHLLSFYLPFFLMCLVSFIFAGIAQLVEQRVYTP